ncbi:fungal-specific transcription factor domain-containing protein [Aspergillus pseudonomiae]|uniref:Fungal-specific transcription factor domain-containing protein n=1 Tax=Aspergillus pseudonomiae TaxID=1506151 RepID=A0A5N7CVH8_9EURO|nr:fungal-specific transcription factor domain-containing protein [Aspergillus pseudonomiae]KAE8397727.1 fungal-specific transcription factor domain-containing protein [Aspergillus pseudonomiae]
MEVQMVACARAKPSSATPQSVLERRKRVRRPHHRGFTGCSTCRRRHVRCDEASPSCKNCTRLGLACDGTQGRMTFKVYAPPQAPEYSSSPAKKREAEKPISHVLNPTDGKKLIRIEPGEEDQFYDALVISPTTIPESKPMKYRFQEPISPAVFMSFSLDCVDGRYYTHFIDGVATLLLIYDNSININPFRRYFPELARASPITANAMQALGALHLANTSRGQQRRLHFQRAMGKYGEVVKSFRSRYTQPVQNLQLTDLATCLLLSFFEMMDSQNHNWKIHLRGAREIYRLLFLPNSDRAKEAQRQAEMNHPLRCFLVSLLSYLDVAGACATSEGTVVEGSYWRTHGGGWEYNLGIPSLSANTSAENPLLVELRLCWSQMMEIQAAISSFGKAKSEGQMPSEQQDLLYQVLMGRLVQWRLNAPKCIQEIGELDDESLKQYPYPQVLEYAGCIESYEKATVVYLHKVAAADRPDRVPQRTLLEMLASRILNLIGKLAKDVGQLAVLWPLFTAGRETRNVWEQKFVRETMINLQRFGFKVRHNDSPVLVT